MGAIGLWVRTTWRRRRVATVFLALVAGLSAAAVAASLQAADRADSSVQRFLVQSRGYDEFVLGCPPGIDPNELDGQAAFNESCLNDTVAEQFRAVLAPIPQVEATIVANTLVIGMLDDSVSNGWGRAGLILTVDTAGAPTVPGRPIIVAGRLPAADAADELVVGEAVARVAHLAVGQEIRMAGWHQDDIDAATDGLLPPQTEPFTSRVVGIVRALDDVQPSDEGNLNGTTWPSYMYAGPAWYAAHGNDLAGYGAGVLARLVDGPASRDDFNAVLDQMPGGWFSHSQALVETGSIDSLERSIDVERQALFVFTVVAAVAGLGFVGLTVLRQLRRELVESPKLMAIGFTRRDLVVTSTLRALTIAVPASVVAVAATIALSPLEPIGSARKVEFGHVVRFDTLILALTVVGILFVFVAIAGIAPRSFAARRSDRPTAVSRVDKLTARLGPVPHVSATFTRRGAARAASLVTAIAIAAAVAAGITVASLDRVVNEPVRYGAWWDVAVGQYSQQGALDDGVAKLRANPAVVAAAGYYDQNDVGTIDGVSVIFLASTPYVGHPSPVTASGRTPASDDEIALGRATAQRIGKHVGDTVELVTNNDATFELQVVGIVVVNDPVTTSSAAGDGAFVTPAVMEALSPGAIPQSIAVRVDPKVDQRAAIESIQRDFPGSIREALPQADTRNLVRLRSVPWLIVALVSVLAFATLVHALATLLYRHRVDLAVLAALGFTRGQRWRVGLFTGVLVAAVGVAIGLPVGAVLGGWLWRVVATRISIESTPLVEAVGIGLAPLVALGIAFLVAASTSWYAGRAPTAAQFRTE